MRSAAAGDPQALQALRRYEDRLARGLAAVLNVLDPDVVVLGGGMSNLPRLAEAAAALLPGYVFSDTVQTKVVPNLHGDSSGVRGGGLVMASGLNPTTSNAVALERLQWHAEAPRLRARDKRPLRLRFR